MASGIYKLTNLSNGKIYVGSYEDIKKRWNAHRSSVRSSVRSGVTLISRALLKYRENNFEWEILEECSSHILLKREQFYLDTLQPFGNRGYNLARVAGNTKGIPCLENTKKKISQANKGKFIGKKSVRAKPTVFRSPDGELVEFESINRGSTERRFHVACMAEVARGVRRQYKGWTCPDAPVWKPAPRCQHVILSPDGERHKIENIKEFCKEHGLSSHSMAQVLTQGQKQHKGWRIPGSSAKQYNLVDPDGNSHTVFELSNFCQKMDLDYVCMISLACGNQRHHRGWTISND